MVTPNDLATIASLPVWATDMPGLNLAPCVIVRDARRELGVEPDEPRRYFGITADFTHLIDQMAGDHLQTFVDAHGYSSLLRIAETAATISIAEMVLAGASVLQLRTVALGQPTSIRRPAGVEPHAAEMPKWAEAVPGIVLAFLTVVREARRSVGSDPEVARLHFGVSSDLALLIDRMTADDLRVFADAIALSGAIRIAETPATITLAEMVIAGAPASELRTVALAQQTTLARTTTYRQAA